MLAQVKRGESVTILDRGVPVARLEPIVAGVDPEGRAQRLERAGVLSAARSAPPTDLLREPPPALHDGASAVEVLLKERRAGR